jgi:hypothetical protein
MRQVRHILTSSALVLSLAALPAAVPGAAYAAPVDVGTFRLQGGSTLPALPGTVTALAAGPGGVVAAAHDKGLAVWSGQTWTQVSGTATHQVAWHGDELVALSGDALLTAKRTGDKWTVTTTKLPHGVDASSALLVGGTAVTVLQGGNAYEPTNGQGWKPTHLPGTVAAAARSADGTLTVATDAGLFEATGRNKWQRIEPSDGKRSVPAATITELTYDTKGRLWIAAAQGIGVRDDKGWTFHGPADGLPVLGFTALAPGADGDVWLGTAQGAVHYDGKTWEYRQGRRWLPDDSVAASAVDGDADAFLGTAGGVGEIEARSTTLADKAKLYEDAIQQRHKRTEYGFVINASLDRPGDLSTAHLNSSDNDGLWTGMYGAAEAFRYAATKDADARANARKAFEALKFLGDVTQGGPHPAPPGFVARSVVPTTGTDPNIADSPEHDKKKREGDAYWKIMDVRWPKSADGKWYWKSDTSADELVGHYFFYALYYDLVAQGDEKAEVASVITRLTDHLIDHGYFLVDHDGKPTRWGFFAPSELNGNAWRREERALYSQSILTFLTIAEHVSGDAKYADAKKKLAIDNGYAMNVQTPKITLGVGGGNQSDDEMAFMNYYHLISYEKDAGLKKTWSRSLYDYWQLEKAELNPFFDFIAGKLLTGAKWTDAYGDFDLTPGGPWLDQSVDTLKRFPINLVDWGQTNANRLDIVKLSPHLRPDDDAEKFGMLRSGTVLPVDERTVTHWNTDPYRLDQGGSGNGEADGTSFLLPYWMGRYFALIKG